MQNYNFKAKAEEIENNDSLERGAFQGNAVQDGAPQESAAQSQEEKAILDAYNRRRIGFIRMSIGNIIAIIAYTMNTGDKAQHVGTLLALLLFGLVWIVIGSVEIIFPEFVAKMKSQSQK